MGLLVYKLIDFMRVIDADVLNGENCYSSSVAQIQLPRRRMTAGARP